MLILKFYILTILLGLSGSGRSLKLFSKFEKIKKKLSKLLNGKKGSELFLNINDLEYPGANETLRKIHKQQWEEYYDCLKQTFAETGIEKTLHPLALMALEGSSITLECKICVSPSELYTIESINWFHNSTMNETLSNIPIDSTDHIIVSPADRSLNIFNVQLNQAGFYWCKLEDTNSAPYYLYVANDSEPIIQVKPEQAVNAEHPKPPEILEDLGLEIFSSWSSWSPCSTCNIVGIKKRFGYCTISLRRPGEVHRKRQIEDLMDATPATNEQEDTSYDQGELRAMAERILVFFGNKIPCRSKYTPKEIQDIPVIKNRKTEVETKFCKPKCQMNLVFEVRDEEGNILESANNSAGVYSMIQGMPEVLPNIERTTMYMKHNKKAELQCPGNLNSDIPIIWKIGAKVLNPLEIHEESNGRISIDSRQRITFKKLRYADSNIYSCWQRGELAGTVRLEVTYEIEFKADHRMMMIGAIAIVSVMLLVFYRAFKGRKRYTKH